MRFKAYDYFDFYEDLLCESDNLEECYRAAAQRIDDTAGECDVYINDTKLEIELHIY